MMKTMTTTKTTKITTTKNNSLSRVILASSSPRRRELLASLGVNFSIHKPDIDETQYPTEAPLDYVRRLSREKAAIVAQSQPAESAYTVLAADTVVILEDVILGKPETPAEAQTMLQALRNRQHQVCTAFTLYAHRPPEKAHIITEHDCTFVTMRDYTDAEIAAYIATGDPFDKAGAYAIQHPVFAPAAHIEGSYTNVVGLPIETLQRVLENLERI